MSDNQNANQNAWMHGYQQWMLLGNGIATAGTGTDGVPENAIIGPSLASKGNLTRHQKTHNQLPSFPCPINGCNRSLNGFNRKDNVVEHLRTVHHIDKEAAKWIMDSRGAVNPLLQSNQFDDLLAPGSASASGEGNGQEGQQGQKTGGAGN
ncbi:MAG: hypothetical protein Q9160_004414 [Pyrenula sp. 1 TL-2023]